MRCLSRLARRYPSVYAPRWPYSGCAASLCHLSQHSPGAEGGGLAHSAWPRRRRLPLHGRRETEEVRVAVVGGPAVRLVAKDPRVARPLRGLLGVRRARVAAGGRARDVVAAPVHDRVALRVAVRLLAALRRRRHARAIGRARRRRLARAARAVAAHGGRHGGGRWRRRRRGRRWRWRRGWWRGCCERAGPRGRRRGGGAPARRRKQREQRAARGKDEDEGERGEDKAEPRPPCHAARLGGRCLGELLDGRVDVDGGGHCGIKSASGDKRWGAGRGESWRSHTSAATTTGNGNTSPPARQSLGLAPETGSGPTFCGDAQNINNAARNMRVAHSFMTGLNVVGFRCPESRTTAQPALLSAGSVAHEHITNQPTLLGGDFKVRSVDQWPC